MSAQFLAQFLAQAIHNRLATDALVQSVLGDPVRAYDTAPEDPVFPYLTYGPLRSEDISADDVIVTRHTLTLHIWSRYAGRLQVFEILHAVNQSIGSQNLSLPNAQTALSLQLYADVLRAPDGRTYHGVLRYAFHVQDGDMS